MVVYGVLSAPDREAVRALAVRVSAVETQLGSHEIESKKMGDNVVNAFNNLGKKFDDNVKELNTRLDSINGRLSRIEGKLE